MSIDITSNNDALTAEVAALRHDIERHVQIAAEQAQEMEQLRALLLYIRNTLCKPFGDPLMQRINSTLSGNKK